MRVAIFSVLAVVVSILAYIPYIRGILRSGTRPTVSTWLSWWIMDMAILIGMIDSGELAYQMIAYVAGSAIVIGVCLYKKASLGWQRIDTACMVIVLAAFVMYVTSNNPNLLIILAVVAVLVGSIPMLVKLWANPSNESLVPWLAAFAGGTCGVLAIPQMTISYALTPIAFFLFQILTIAFIMRRPAKT